MNPNKVLFKILPLPIDKIQVGKYYSLLKLSGYSSVENFESLNVRSLVQQSVQNARRSNETVDITFLAGEDVRFNDIRGEIVTLPYDDIVVVIAGTPDALKGTIVTEGSHLVTLKRI